MKRICILTLVLAVASIAAARSFTPKQLDEWLKAGSTFQTGKDSGPLVRAEKAIIEASADPKLRAEAEASLLRALNSATTREGKSFLCRQLCMVGTARCIPHLEKLLPDPDSSHMARYVLARLEYPEAAAAMHRALAKTSHAARVGVINSLGDMQHRAATSDLAKLLRSGDRDAASAAARSLGHIGGPDAVKALRAARAKARSGLKQRIDNALLIAAESAMAVGRTDEAEAIYRSFYTPKFSLHFRLAGLRGLMGIEGGAPTDLLLKAIQDKDPGVRGQMIAIMTEAPGPQATRTFTNLLPSLPADSQVRMLGMLAARGDALALPAVMSAVKSDNQAVRLAAIDALGELGDETAVPLLALHAATNSGSERDRARSSLDRLKPNSVNPALAKLLANSNASLRSEAARSLAARGAAEMAGAVMKLAGDRNPAVRKTAMKALKGLAIAEHVPGLLSLLLKADDNVWRGEVEQTLLAVVRRIPEKAQAARTGLSVLGSAKTDAGRAAVLRMLGETGHASALQTLLDGAKDAKPTIKDAAIRALAAWPGVAPGNTLRAIALDAGNSRLHRVIAMRGYIEKIGMYEQADDKEILRRYEEAMQKAMRPEEVLLVLSKLSAIRHPGALALVKRVKKTRPKVKASAAAAEKKIERLLARPRKVAASHNSGNAGLAVDGNAGTRWDTATPMTGGEWFTIDMGFAQPILGLTMDTRGSKGDYPRGYEIYVSPNVVKRGALVTKGKGTGPLLDLAFQKPVKGRLVTIVQTGKTNGLFWSIHELRVKTKK